MRLRRPGRNLVVASDVDRIDLLRIFARVVECSNFTRAADTLGLPRSSVSAAVLELEGRVGTRLLHRTTRKVSLTQDGATFYERCVQLVADYTEVETFFRESSVGPSGRIRVDVPGRVGAWSSRRRSRNSSLPTPASISISAFRTMRST